MELEEFLPKDILESEETANMIYSIREEIIENVMNECRRIYLEKQSIHFLVQCVYDALVKYLSMNFYYHPEPPDTTHPEWTPDEHIAPSPKDTWACDGVSIRPNIDEPPEFQTKTSLEDFCVVDAKKNPYCADGDELCMCMNYKTEQEDVELEFDRQVELLSVHPPSKVQFTSESSETGLSENTMSTSRDKMTPSSSFVERVTSDLSSSKNKKGRKMDKLSSNVKEEIPGPAKRGSQASMVDLPPIRFQKMKKSVTKMMPVTCL